MALKVVHDGSEPGEPAENCCLCRAPTRWWWGTGARNVALCQSCAKAAKKADLPTKADWIAKERALQRAHTAMTHPAIEAQRLAVCAVGSHEGLAGCRTERVGCCTLHLADYRDVLPTLQGVTAIVADPPYGNDYRQKRSRDKLVRPDTTHAPIVGNAEPFDPSPLLQAAPVVVLWGAKREAVGLAWRSARLTSSASGAEARKTMDILKDLTDAEVATLAKSPTPRPMQGTWVLTAPDGQTWTGESPMKCVQEEMHSRVPPQVALARIRQSTWFPFPTGGEGGGLTQCDMHDDESN